MLDGVEDARPAGVHRPAAHLGHGQAVLGEQAFDGVPDVLPEDVGNATVYDAIDIIERIKECGRKYPEPDAGKP